MTTDKKWYAIQYEEGYWAIQDYNGVDQLWEGDFDDKKAIGAEQAEKNAKLCAAAPEMRQLLEDMAIWIESYMNTSGQHDRNGARYTLEQYRKLEKQLQ